MRRALLLLPFVLVGCRAGRQAAVSSDGRVASTYDNGTFVAGRGKVAEGGSDVAWSPDGQTLAIAAKDGVVLWPSGDRISKLRGPLAWNAFGDQLAGIVDKHVAVRNLTTGETRTAQIEGSPIELRWTGDGRLMSLAPEKIEIEGGPALPFKGGNGGGAVPLSDGTVAYLQWAEQPKQRSEMGLMSLRMGLWDPRSGANSLVPIARMDSLFGAASSRRLAVPSSFALAPDGRRFAAAGTRIEAGPRVLARLKALADKTKLNPIEAKEAATIMKTIRMTSVVSVIDAAGHSNTLWTAPTPALEAGPTDLSWSPDGKWLAIARKDGTVRVATGE